LIERVSQATDRMLDIAGKDAIAGVLSPGLGSKSAAHPDSGRVLHPRSRGQERGGAATPLPRGAGDGALVRGEKGAEIGL